MLKGKWAISISFVTLSAQVLMQKPLVDTKNKATLTEKQQ